MSGLTKILIVLQLVFSLALSVVVVMMVSKQESYKTDLDAYRAGSLALSATVAQLNADKAMWQQNVKDAHDSLQNAQRDAMTAGIASAATIAHLSADVQTAKAEAAKLAAQNRTNEITINSQQAMIQGQRSQIDEMTPKTTKLIAENAGLNRANAELTTANNAAEQTIKRLQEQLVQLPQAPATGANASDQQRTITASGLQTPVQINGQVTDIAQSAGRTLIETKLGTRDGVKSQTRLAIYRGNSYIGDAVVTTVTTDTSVAVVMMVKPGETVQKGDLVMSGQ